MNKSAILLMNLGSPDSPTAKALKPYLTEFLMDERVIDLPFLLRTLIVRGIIVPFRSPASAKKYQSIWTDEGSSTSVLKDCKVENTKFIQLNCIQFLFLFFNEQL